MTCLELARAGSLYVDQASPDAADTNPGTEAAPFKTIGAVVKAVRPGDTVCVCPGVYREAIGLAVSGEPDRPIILRSKLPHQAVISGSDVVQTWTAVEPGVWSAPVPMMAAAKPEDTQQDSGDTALAAQWLYLDGAPLSRADDRDALLPGMFYPDPAAKVVYLATEDGQPPTGHLLEYAWRTSLMYLEKPAHDLQISGFSFTKNASWVFNGAAINLWNGTRIVVEDNQVAWSSAMGIFTALLKDSVIRNNVVDWSGWQGSNGYVWLNVRFENNRILHGNWRRFNPSWSAGGSKFAWAKNCLVRGNEYAYHFGPGLWFDICNSGNIIEKNVCHDNLGRDVGPGLFSEISWGEIIRDNVCFNNDIGIMVGESPAELLQHNVVFNNRTGVTMRWFFRPGMGLNGEAEQEKIFADMGVDAQTLDRWKAEYLLYHVLTPSNLNNNNALYQNALVNNSLNYDEHRDYSKLSKDMPMVHNQSDENLYYATAPERYFGFNGTSYGGGLENWQKISGRDAHSTVINPRVPAADLPAWLTASKDLWAKDYRSAEEIDALGLAPVVSPMSAELLARLRRATTAVRFPVSDHDVQAVLYTMDGVRTLALWRTQTQGRSSILLHLPLTGQDQLSVEDAYGNKQARTLLSQMLDLGVTWAPVYIHGVGEVQEVQSNLLRVPGFNAPDAAIPVEAVFANPGRTKMDVAITFAVSKGFTASPAQLTSTLEPDASVTLATKLVPDGTLRAGNATLRMTGSAGAQPVQRLAAFSVGQSSGAIPHLARPICIDASLEHWGDIVSKAPPLATLADISQLANGDAALWKGPNDLSDNCYMAWRDGSLYWAVVVTDDAVVSTPAGETPFNSDCVELFIDGRNPAMQWQKEFTAGCAQIGVSPASEKLPLATYLNPSTLQGVEVATSRTETGYISSKVVFRSQRPTSRRAISKRDARSRSPCW